MTLKQRPALVLFISTACLFISLGLGFLYLEFPGRTLFWTAMQNSAHAVAFFILTILGLSFVSWQKPAMFWGLLGVPMLLFCFGVLVEYGQFTIGRSTGLVGSLRDIKLNFFGIASACALFSAFWLKGKQKLGSLSRFALAAVSLILMSISLYQPVLYLIASWSTPQIPTLANFDGTAASMKIRPYKTRVGIAVAGDVWSGNKTIALKVTLKRNRWSGVQLLEPGREWNNYDALTFRVMNTSTRDIRLMVQIRAKISDDYTYVYARREIHPGESKAEIDISKFTEALRLSDNLNAEIKLDSVLFAMFGANESEELYFDDLLLL